MTHLPDMYYVHVFDGKGVVRLSTWHPDLFHAFQFGLVPAMNVRGLVRAALRWRGGMLMFEPYCKASVIQGAHYMGLLK